MGLSPSILIYDPVTGLRYPEPMALAQWRSDSRGEAWLYDPWTGKHRCPRSIGSDPRGFGAHPPLSARQKLLQRIYAACITGNRRVFEDLIQMGIHLDQPTSASGWSALMIALANKQLELSRFLLQNGASPIFRTDEGVTALSVAASCFDVLDLMIRTDAKQDVDFADKEGKTPLMIAANLRSGYLASRDLSIEPERARCLALLLEHGAEIDLQDSKGRTALMVAAHSGASTMVEALLEAGARKGLRCSGGMSAADWAFDENIKQIIRAPRLRVV